MNALQSPQSRSPISSIRVPIVVAALAAGALVAATAAAGNSVPNFTCDASHTPVNGATYKNLDATGECTIRGESVTVTGNLSVEPLSSLLLSDGSLRVGGNADVTGGLGVDGGGSLTVGGNASISGLVNVGTHLPSEPMTVTVGGDLSLDGGAVNAQSTNSTSPMTFRIGGNLTASNTWDLRLVGLPGDLSVAGRTTITGAGINGVEIAYGQFGPVTIEHAATTPSAGVFVFELSIAGSLAFLDNLDGFNFIGGNRITEDQNCSGNTPPPTNVDRIGTAWPNTVSGHETGQCEGL